MITRCDVDQAAARINDSLRTTPLVRFDSGGFGTASAWLKLEQLQYTGSFKARGALNRVRSLAERGALSESGVVAASGGNAGLAVAFAAAQHHVPARVYVPETVPTVKITRLRQLGADVVPVGTQYAHAHEAAIDYARGTTAAYCHAYDQPDICAGQGTLGQELLEQTAGAVDTVLLAAGGGGLLAGVATAIGDTARVIGVEPENAPALHAALDHGQPVDVPVSGVAADSLGATRIGEIAYDVANRHAVGSVLVDDEAISSARQLLWDEHRVVTEHGTAAALAALTSGRYRPTPGERVAVVLCGANTNVHDLG